MFSLKRIELLFWLVALLGIVLGVQRTSLTGRDDWDLDKAVDERVKILWQMSVETGVRLAGNEDLKHYFELQRMDNEEYEG